MAVVVEDAAAAAAVAVVRAGVDVVATSAAAEAVARTLLPLPSTLRMSLPSPASAANKCLASTLPHPI